MAASLSWACQHQGVHRQRSFAALRFVLVVLPFAEILLKRGIVSLRAKQRGFELGQDGNIYPAPPFVSAKPRSHICPCAFVPFVALQALHSHWQFSITWSPPSAIATMCPISGALGTCCPRSFLGVFTPHILQAQALILFGSHAVVPRTNNGLVRARIVLTHVVGSLILASACPFLGLFPRFLSVTATLDAVFVNPRAKQLEVVILV